MRGVLITVCLGLLMAGPCLAEKVFLGTARPIDPAKSYPKFHIGVTGINATVEEGLLVTVHSTEPGTPAAGKFQKGDVLVAVNGAAMSDPEPYIALGNAITAAEAGDGKLAFAVKRGDAEAQIDIVIPVLGAYSKTWPLNCKKSDTIVRQAAAFIAKDLHVKPIRRDKGYLGALALLSTGEDKYLPIVKARLMKFRNSSQTWQNGYFGITMAEYYLRTGDKDVLPLLQSICDDSAARQVYRGWGHWGFGYSPGYTQGGLMNAAGAQILTTLILAKECGVKVNPKTFHDALAFFYRFAGHGSMGYGDHRPEMWHGANGKNGMLAAPLSLLEGKSYRMAAEHIGLDMADSYMHLGTGHGSTFCDHTWRGLAAVHLPKDKQHHYRRCLDKLTWCFDLARRPDGGFSLLNLGGYVAEHPVWAHGLVLTYTAPRKTLRITGAPRTRYSQKVSAPARPWGRPADLEFLRTDYCEGFGDEQFEPHQIKNKFAELPKKMPAHYRNVKPWRGDTRAATAFCVKMIRHYHPVFRDSAAKSLVALGAMDELVEALEHPDCRVRRAALDGIDNYRAFFRDQEGPLPRAVVSEKFLPSIEKILANPEISMWELDGAMCALSRAEPADIAKHLDLARKHLSHEDWWLRESAANMIMGLAGDEKLLASELPALLDCVRKETHIPPRRHLMEALNHVMRSRAASQEIKDQIIHGMVRVQRELGIEKGYRAAIGLNNKYETAGFLLSNSPQTASQVLDEYERILSQSDYAAGKWHHLGALMTGHRSNPGLLNAIAKLPEDQRPAQLARCKKLYKRMKELAK